MFQKTFPTLLTTTLKSQEIQCSTLMVYEVKITLCNFQQGVFLNG